MSVARAAGEWSRVGLTTTRLDSYSTCQRNLTFILLPTLPITTSVTLPPFYTVQISSFSHKPIVNMPTWTESDERKLLLCIIDKSAAPDWKAVSDAMVGYSDRACQYVFSSFCQFPFTLSSFRTLTLPHSTFPRPSSQPPTSQLPSTCLGLQKTSVECSCIFSPNRPLLDGAPSPTISQL